MRNNITFGGGKLYIKPKGEEAFKYFGTTDSMSISTEVEKKEHMNTESAIPSIDAEVITKQSASLSWSSADMSIEMMSFAFRGEVSTTTPPTTLKQNIKAPCIIDTHAYGGEVDVKLGSSALKKDDYKFDARTGLLEILKITTPGELVVTITGAKEAKRFDAFKSAKTEASLMFISDAAIGNAFKYEFYKVNISQDGEMALKGDDFMSVSFSANVLKDESKPEGEQFYKITELINE